MHQVLQCIHTHVTSGYLHRAHDQIGYVWEPSFLISPALFGSLSPSLATTPVDEAPGDLGPSASKVLLIT